MLRGEIWWARVPMKGSDRKKRPMLVVSHDAFNLNESYLKVMVVHITTVKRLSGPYDWEVFIPRGTAGLKRSGVAKCGEIYTLWKEQLQGSTGTCSRELMARVDRALAVALSLGVEA